MDRQGKSLVCLALFTNAIRREGLGREVRKEQRREAKPQKTKSRLLWRSSTGKGLLSEVNQGGRKGYRKWGKEQEELGEEEMEIGTVSTVEGRGRRTTGCREKRCGE